MTAQPRRLLLRIAAVGALVSGAVLLPATAALADVNANPGQLTLKPGEEKTITVTLSDLVGNPQADITVSGLGGDVTLRGPGGCSASNGGLRCNQNAFDKDGDDEKVTITVSHKAQTSVQQGQSKDGSISISAGGVNGDDSVNVTLQGPQQAASASEVNGTVTDQGSGDPVPGAQLSVKDSAGNTLDATANNQGKWSIKSSQSKPIAPGQVTVKASKEGFADATGTGNAQSGKALTINLRMKPTAASTGPSAPVASDAQPTDPPSTDASGLAQPGQNTSGEDEGTSMLSWVLIGMGILLVLLGIGAIVLLVMRRKDDSDDPDGYGNDPNQVAPVGAGAYGAPGATMVGGRSNMNDATAIVGPQQQLDEFPDPYAAPPPAPAPTRVGGGAYSGGYNDPQATSVAPGYGRGGEYANGSGYRDERGYGESQRGGYGDEPRGGYGGGAGGGGGYADQPTGHYQGGGDQGGYPAAGGYPAGANGSANGGANGSDYGANGSGYGGGGANGYGGGAGGANGSAYGGAGGYGGGANGGANGGGANGYGGGYEDEYGRGGGGGYQGGQGGQGGQGQQGGPQGGGGYERGGGDYAGDQRNGRNRSVDWLE